MKKGLAPQIMEDGMLRSMELHHILGREGDYFYFFFEISPKGHSIVDPFRHL